MKTLSEYLELAAVAHGHLCAGQVLGVRLAMLGLAELGIADPVAERKRIVTYVEIDRCVTDAVALVTHCRLGKRALKFRDWGKVAATFVDLQTGRAVRIAAKESSKQVAREMFPELPKDAGQQKAYAALSSDVLFDKQWVKVSVLPEDLPGFKGPRVVCAECGEGINFKREVVLGDRTVCRSCAGEKYYIPIARVLLAFLLLSLSSVAHAHQYQRNNERPAACDQYDQLEAPVADLPTQQDRQALASCSSEDLYFGFGQAAAPAEARKCAYVEREHSGVSQESVFGGAGLLLMVYANGKGATRNFGLALKFACEVDGAPAENKYRIEHLLKLDERHWTGEDFSLCDDATSGFMQGACAALQDKFDRTARDGKLDEITAPWSASEREAFHPLEQAARAFFQASSRNEVDLRGTGRAAFEIHAQATLNDDFVAALQRFEKGRWPSYSSMDFGRADAELNSVYAKIQAEPHSPAMATITPRGIKLAQRAWLAYREAWVKFGQLKYPDVTPDSWRTWLTEGRVKMLKNLT